MGKRVINLEKREKNMNEMINEFLNFKITQGSADLTLRDYKKTFKQFEHYNYDFMEYLKSKTGGSPARFNIPYSNLNAFYNWCVRQEYLEYNPLIKSGLKKIRDDGRIRVASINDIQKLMKVIDTKTYVGLRDYTIIMLMLDSGIRPKEVFGLSIDCFDDEIITIDKKVAKTRQKRLVPISKIVSSNIKKLIEIKPTTWKNDFIFCSYDGEQMHGIMFDRRLYIYSEQAKVKITPYDLRHTFATMYLNNKGNVFALQRIMGHSDLRMTKRYIAISDEQLIEQHSISSPLNNILVPNKRIARIDRL